MFSTSVVILDFDGVIADTGRIKTDAFRELFGDEKLVGYHKKNLGMPRRDKFIWYFNTVRKKKPSSAELSETEIKFALLLRTHLVNVRLVYGAKKLITKIYAEHKKLYIVSGAPREEVLGILNRKKIHRFFSAVYTCVNNKEKTINTILRKEKLKPCEVLFIGDGETDFVAADKTKVRFLFRVHDDNKDQGIPGCIEKITSFNGVHL